MKGVSDAEIYRWQCSRVRLYRVQECLSSVLVFVAVVNQSAMMTVHGAPHSVVTAVNMACVFWDSQGVIFVDFVPSGFTVNAKYYSTLLSDWLRGLPSVKSVRMCYGKASYCSMIMLHHRRLVRQQRKLP